MNKKQKTNLAVTVSTIGSLIIALIAGMNIVGQVQALTNDNEDYTVKAEVVHVNSIDEGYTLETENNEIIYMSYEVEPNLDLNDKIAVVTNGEYVKDIKWKECDSNETLAEDFTCVDNKFWEADSNE